MKKNFTLKRIISLATVVATACIAVAEVATTYIEIQPLNLCWWAPWMCP